VTEKNVLEILIEVRKEVRRPTKLPYHTAQNDVREILINGMCR